MYFILGLEDVFLNKILGKIIFNSTTSDIQDISVCFGLDQIE